MLSTFPSQCVIARPRRLRAATVWSFGVIVTAAVLTGCEQADPNRVAVFPVTGAATLNGQPLPAGALVVLHPKNTTDARVLPARGHVGSDGTFKITTYEDNDGAAAGDYAVTVTYYPPVQKGDSVAPGPNVLPRKYENAVTTDLVIHVAEGDNQLPPLTLTR